MKLGRMSVWRAFVLSSLFLVLGTALASAGSETTRSGDLEMTTSARLSPNRLPRVGRAPVAVSLGWKVATTDASTPSTLKRLRIEINRNGILDSSGLPVCPYAKIQPASTQRALRNCRSSLVGRGSFAALVGLEGQESYVAKGEMVVFNAEKSGKPVLFGQIYSSYPFANSFVIVFKVSREKRGEYGTTLTATLPATLRTWGNLTEINMRLSREYGYKGEKRSFLSAGCPAPKGFPGATFSLARTSFSFADGTRLVSRLSSNCKVRWRSRQPK